MEQEETKKKQIDETVDNTSKTEMINLIVEAYRLRNFTANLVKNTNDVRLIKRASNIITRFDKHFLGTLNTFNLELLDFTGHVYETGLPVHPINLADFEGEDILVIEAMIEPVIKESNSANILKPGVVVVGKRN